MSKPKANDIQKNWRWNFKPLRIRIHKAHSSWNISWERWDWRNKCWREWRAYCGTGPLRDVIGRYRDYAKGWRGQEDAYW